MQILFGNPTKWQLLFIFSFLISFLFEVSIHEIFYVSFLSSVPSAQLKVSNRKRNGKKKLSRLSVPAESQDLEKRGRRIRSSRPIFGYMVMDREADLTRAGLFQLVSCTRPQLHLESVEACRELKGVPISE